MRISVENGGRFFPVDENFNKHVVFHSGGVTGNISYAGVARWTNGARTISLYDVISEAASEGAANNLDFAPFVDRIVQRIRSELTAPSLRAVRSSIGFELHIIGYHKQIPVPFIAVVTTLRGSAPWSSPAHLQWKWDFSGLKVYLEVAEVADVIFGGVDHVVRAEERKKILDAVNRNADAFNISKLAARLVTRASERTSTVGQKSVSILLPREGFLDTNMWEQTPTGINAFIPTLAFPNGTTVGPSIFPVDMKLVTTGYLPKQSLFFKSVVTRQYKRSLRRRLFRHHKGKAIPGVMGLLMLALFGKIPEGYEDFGLLSES